METRCVSEGGNYNPSLTRRASIHDIKNTKVTAIKIGIKIALLYAM